MIRFEVWAKKDQQSNVCALLGRHVDPINKQIMLSVTM